MALADSQPAGVAITNAFGYNVRSEVTSAAMGINTYGYVFDPIGNRIVSTNNAEVTSYAANELNQYTSILSASAPLREPSHDDDGNMTSTGEGWHYEWNGENRLILASNETALVSYAYDHQGCMVWTKISRGGAEAQSWEEEKSITYLWDNFNIIAETVISGSATNTTYNIWGLDIDGTIQGAGGVGGLLAVIQDSATYVPAWDANGNIIGYTDANGVITAAREYDSFGNTINASGSTCVFSHWFSTKPLCFVTSWYGFQFRMYCPEFGRWASRDLIQEHGGVNLFIYTSNNGINYIDSLGMQTKC